jgi:hypothetical protein
VPPERCDSRIALHAAALRVNSSVLPSGVNVGEPSLAGLEITPGANSCGVGSASACANADQARIAAISFMRAG